MLFDTHTHAYFPELSVREDEVVENMRVNNIRFAAQIGCDVESTEAAIALTRKYPDVYRATVGYHPSETQNHTLQEAKVNITRLEQLLAEHREYIVAIGEIGLDYYHLDTERIEEQKHVQFEVFRRMSELANSQNLPAIIHTRNAREDTLRLIREFDLKKCIIHCFSEDFEFARELMDFSDEVYFSFSGILTYSKALAIQNTASRIPLDRILIETDAPFLSPQAVRGTINESANVRYVLEKLQNLRNENAAEIEKQVYENSLRVYGINA